jgi:transcriptional regulator with XRE-family HTH domain
MPDPTDAVPEDVAERRKRLGAAIRHHRGHLSQDELAKRLGMTQAGLSRWEIGDRDLSYEQVRAVEDALGLSLGTIGRDAGFVQELPVAHDLVIEATYQRAEEAATAVTSADHLGLGIVLRNRWQPVGGDEAVAVWDVLIAREPAAASAG